MPNPPNFQAPETSSPNKPSLNSKMNEILLKFQNGEASEEETLKALGKTGQIRYGMDPNHVDSCTKPEFDVKISNFSFYTRRQGRINVYFSFTPVDFEAWSKKIPNCEATGEDEKYSGI